MIHPVAMRETLKQMAGQAAAALTPQCRYDRAIFILAHMRCGSTALSNILCSRPDVSGYGEAHIRYRTRADLGRLVVNQTLRRSWQPRARHLFDKILHSRHDAEAPPAFFQSRAIFVARDPGPAIRSIRKLYEGLGRDEYGTDTQAATYYVERLAVLQDLWARFPPDRRVGLTHAGLLSDPEGALAAISAQLRIAPPLENTYRSRPASRSGGAGDPVVSAQHTKIVPKPILPDSGPPLEISPDLARQTEEAYRHYVATVSA